ncbi:CHRD domain-containing protein [Actimicrobium sp. CCI2.3]|uniref:CHRD domain-containing protein n=1 Tax=Actimicrobium sp. CCI2.3 TaxID=3048616 RepID=UPI002AB32F40|nr:CHRD domain-containing protein [Actimicrobium sp. CCI2.3]MDY7574058.1 CHRD domain-containing protein [Actimicrobium sp. CCI2.3]MEB0021834.1 CHRD domain-containing protein [Actimicrobium sp. CCI2.3]
MNIPFARVATALAIAVTVLAAAGCATQVNMPLGDAKLNGTQEVPPVSTSAIGTAMITVTANKSVSGRVTTSGLEGKAAHIHQGAPGMNGGVVIGLTKNTDGSWSVPLDAKLTDAQYASYQAGNLYVNVHTAANPGGEIRAQLNAR